MNFDKPRRPSRRPRDTQRQRVYRAEGSCPWYFKGQRIESVPEIQTYVDKLISSSWYRASFPSAPMVVKVHDGRGGYKARAGDFDIFLPTRMRTIAVILHELTHTIVSGMNRTLLRKGIVQLHPAHGWMFANTELALIRQVIGGKEAGELRTAFDVCGVRGSKLVIRKPTKREMTPEQKQAATARLAAWREKKRTDELFEGWRAAVAAKQPEMLTIEATILTVGFAKET